MTPISVMDSPLAARLGWTILHSCWQLLGIWLLLAICLPVLRRKGPQLVSAICCVSLLLCLLVPTVTFMLLPTTFTDTAAERDRNGLLGPVPRSVFTAQPSQTGVPPAVMHEPQGVSFSLAVGDEPDDKSQVSPSTVTAISQAGGPAEAARRATLTSWVSSIQRVLPSIVSLWLAGVLILSIWNCAAWVIVQRLRWLETMPVPASILEIVTRLARELGVTTRIQVLQSRLVDSPIVIGAFKPMILLPMTLILELPPDQVEALLAHELAHILRRDYLINLLQTVIETLLFYHPAVWWISSHVRRERELCCDDVALRLTADKTIYVKALAAVAGARSISLASAANGGQLLFRLQRVLGLRPAESARPAGWLVGVSMLSFCAVIASFWLTSSRNVLAQTQPETATKLTDNEVKQLVNPILTTSGKLTIHVVGPDAVPMADAKLHASVWTDEPNFPANRDYSTDAQGNAVIELPKTLEILRIWCRKPNHCPLFVQWWPKEQTDDLQLPLDFTFAMTRGTTVAGFVKNTEGVPIPRVLVQAQQLGKTASTSHRFSHDAWLASGTDPDKGEVDGPLYTDENGRWTLHNVPADEGADIKLFLTHPDYISDQYWGGMQREQQITMSQFRNQTATIVMERGVSLAGQVITPDGQPVDKAVVVWGDDPYFTQGSQEVLTNAAGQFRIPPLAKGQTRVTVIAKGWMPQMKMIDLNIGAPDVQFHLKPGKTLRVQFVDDKGTPLTDVGVGIQFWKSARALYNDRHPNVIDTQIPREVSDEGIFEWTWAPDDGVTYNFGKAGYASVTKMLTAGDGVQKLVLNRESLQRTSTISGSVHDAVSGALIQNITMVPVNHYDARFSGLERINARTFAQGKFAFELERTDIQQDIQIEALGYRIFRTNNRNRPGQPDQVLDVRLQPVPRYTGRVVDPQGQPVSKARVYVATAYQHLRLFNLDEGDRNDDGDYLVHTNSAGEFEILAQIEPYAIVVVAPQGYAEICHGIEERPGTVTLKSWAKVTGRLVQAGQPVAKQPVMIDTIDGNSLTEPNISNTLRVTTGTNGEFTFTRVPPVTCRVSGELHFARDSVLTSDRYVPLDPQPGQTLEVPLGEGGATLTGRLVAEDQPADFDYHFSMSYLVAKRPGVARPAALEGIQLDWRQGWNDAWRGTTEGFFYLNTLHHWYVKPSPDGTIQISGVEPGEYELAINLFGSSEGCLVYPVAQRVIPLTVTAGQSAVDLGRLTIPSSAILKPGDSAPELTGTDNRGQPLSLSQFRGHPVVLSFWASWCSACVGHLEDLERLRRQQSNENLVVVGVNLDQDADRARTLIDTKSRDSQHVMLGDWSKTSVPRQFGVSYLPTYVLIDRTGKVLLHTSRWEQLNEALSQTEQ